MSAPETPRDLITGIVEQRPYFKLTFNGQESLYAHHKLLEERPLAVGDELSLAEYRAWLLLRQYPAALNDAVRLLGVRARSEREIAQKLRERRYLDETIDMVLCKLEKEKLVNDAAFAAEWAGARTQQKLGKGRVYQELLQKGVSSAVAQAALDALPDDPSGAREQAAKLLRRYAGEPDSRKAMTKVLQGLQRRGFGFDEAKEAVEAALKQMEEE